MSIWAVKCEVYKMWSMYSMSWIYKLYLWTVKYVWHVKDVWNVKAVWREDFPQYYFYIIYERIDVTVVDLFSLLACQTINLYNVECREINFSTVCYLFILLCTGLLIYSQNAKNLSSNMFYIDETSSNFRIELRYMYR